MKFNKFLFLISILIAALAGYGLYSLNRGEQNVWLITIFGSICLAVTLIGIISVSTEGRAGSFNISALSTIFIILFIICNLVFSFTEIKTAPYVIINGILFLFYISSIYGIVKSKQ